MFAVTDGEVPFYSSLIPDFEHCRTLIDNRYKKSIQWIATAEAITRGQDKLTLENTTSFVRESENFLLFARSDLVQHLKDQMKRAKIWISKLQQVGSVNSASALDPFIKEAEEIAIDLRENLDEIVKHVEVFCLCRQVSHGVMVACERCEDWFHIGCIGMSKAQVISATPYFFLA